MQRRAKYRQQCVRVCRPYIPSITKDEAADATESIDCTLDRHCGVRQRWTKVDGTLKRAKDGNEALLFGYLCGSDAARQASTS